MATAELRHLVEEAGSAFPATAWVWQALRVRGGLLVDDPGFCWGLLPLFVCQSAGGEPARALPLAAAFECSVAAAFAVDDLQDKGSPEALWRSCGEPTASNVVVNLLFLSQRALVHLLRFGVGPDRVVEVTQLWAEAGTRACAGQQLDIDSVAGPDLSEDDYLTMVSGKSASVVEWACRCGALLADAAPTAVEAFAAFGRDLGIALQIRNDIAGVLPHNVKHGDLWYGKRTLPVIHALMHTDPAMRDQMVRALRGSGASPQREQQLTRLRNLLISSRSVEYAAFMAEVFWEKALGQLADVTMGCEEPLREALAWLRDRGIESVGSSSAGTT